jgi:hypothetical protein
MNDVNETASILETIEGGQELLDWFSGFPTFGRDFPDFGDSEVVSFHLRRKGASELVIHVERASSSAIVTLVFGDWIDTQLRGFSHQNVISGLTLRHAGDRDIGPGELGVGCTPGLHVIELEPCFGAAGIIRAAVQKVRLQVLSSAASSS